MIERRICMINFGSKSMDVYDVFGDCGNSSTKVNVVLPNHEVVKVVIPTLVSTGENRMYQGSYIVRNYEGENYVVGDENKTVNTNINLSKMDMTHKLTLFTGIHQCVPDGAIINLYVGLPIQTYYNAEHRKEYVAYYKEKELITLNVNNVEKTFYINKVVAMPESVGYVFNSPVDSLVGVVDIGYTTIDGAVFKDCSPILESVFSLVDGANPYKTKVRDELNKQLLLNIQSYQLDEILTKGMFGSKSKQAQEIIHKCQKEYLKKIVNEMLKHAWEIQTLPIVFTGGGSLLLKDIIEEYETFSISNNPLCDNVDGFAEMGLILSE